MELRKDGKYRERVEEAGGSFVPLVVECLGRWSPYAMKFDPAICAAMGVQRQDATSTACLYAIRAGLACILRVTFFCHYFYF